MNFEKCAYIDGFVKLGYIWKRVALQSRDSNFMLGLCVLFAINVYLCSKEMLVFLNETETDRKGIVLRGMPEKFQKLLARGEHISVISSLSVLCCKIVRGSMNGETFVENQLMPILIPFNGYNQRSVVVMENCSIHHVDGIATGNRCPDSMAP